MTTDPELNELDPVLYQLLASAYSFPETEQLPAEVALTEADKERIAQTAADLG